MQRAPAAHVELELHDEQSAPPFPLGGGADPASAEGAAASDASDGGGAGAAWPFGST
jgi:hypothetical protein